MHDDEFTELRTSTRNIWGQRSLEAVLERRADLAGRQEKLAAYAHRSAPQDAEFDQNSAEIIFLDELAGEKTTEARRSAIARGTALMADEGNLERPGGGSGIGAPALVKDARRDRLETPDEVIQRAGNPWPVHAPPGARCHDHADQRRLGEPVAPGVPHGLDEREIVEWNHLGGDDRGVGG